MMYAEDINVREQLLHRWKEKLNEGLYAYVTYGNPCDLSQEQGSCLLLCSFPHTSNSNGSFNPSLRSFCLQ